MTTVGCKIPPALAIRLARVADHEPLTHEQVVYLAVKYFVKAMLPLTPPPPPKKKTPRRRR